MKEYYPVEQLLQQWLLLPLFADIGLIALVLRSARGRAGYPLAALLSVLAVKNASDLWPGAPPARLAGAACAGLVAPLLLLFLVTYSGGKHYSSTMRPVLVLLPAFLFLVIALGLGWQVSHPAFLAFSAGYYILAAASLASAFSGEMLSGKEPALIGAALILLFIPGPLYDFALAGVLPLTLFPYSSAAAGALLAYAVIRFKSFSTAPLAEETGPGQPELSVHKGIYLARKERAGRARALFADAARHGLPGLAVTRDHPAAFRRQTGLSRVPVIWLAPSTYEKSLHPGELDVLLHALRDCATRREHSVLLLENLDYLVTNAGLHETFDLLRSLRSIAEKTGAVFLLSSELLTEGERREISELGVKPLR